MGRDSFHLHFATLPHDHAGSMHPVTSSKPRSYSGRLLLQLPRADRVVSDVDWRAAVPCSTVVADRVGWDWEFRSFPFRTLA